MTPCGMHRVNPQLQLPGTAQIIYLGRAQQTARRGKVISIAAPAPDTKSRPLSAKAQR